MDGTVTQAFTTLLGVVDDQAIYFITRAARSELAGNADDMRQEKEHYEQLLRIRRELQSLYREVTNTLEVPAQTNGKKS